MQRTPLDGRNVGTYDVTGTASTILEGLEDIPRPIDYDRATTSSHDVPIAKMQISQLIAELYGCGSALDDPAELVRTAREGAEAAGARIVDQHVAAYPGHGSTVVVFLAESHVVVTTWPEHRLALVDILLCNDRMNPEIVLERLVGRLDPTGGVQRQVVERTVADSPRRS